MTEYFGKSRVKADARLQIDQDPLAQYRGCTEHQNALDGIRSRYRYAVEDRGLPELNT